MVFIPAIKILLVDDDKDMCDSLKDIFSLVKGTTIKCSTSPIKSLELIKKNNFDLVFVDYKMPKMNGVELIKKILEIKPDTHIFMLTAFISNNLINEAQTAGAKKVLSKFIWPDELIKIIENYQNK